MSQQGRVKLCDCVYLFFYGYPPPPTLNLAISSALLMVADTYVCMHAGISSSYTTGT